MADLANSAAMIRIVYLSGGISKDEEGFDSVRG